MVMMMATPYPEKPKTTLISLKCEQMQKKNVPENVLMLMTNEHFKLVISTVLTLEITKEAVETYQ